LSCQVDALTSALLVLSALGIPVVGAHSTTCRPKKAALARGYRRVRTALSSQVGRALGVSKPSGSSKHRASAQSVRCRT
jgi:hypothetical protein